jgi:regulator of RNase E activity RraB
MKSIILLILLFVCSILQSWCQDYVVNPSELKRIDSDANLTILGLRKYGSDLNKPHNIRHHVFVPSLWPAMEVKTWGYKNGFKTTQLISKEIRNKRYYYLEIIRIAAPSKTIILNDARKIISTLARYDGMYDYWTCRVTK